MKTANTVMQDIQILIRETQENLKELSINAKKRDAWLTKSSLEHDRQIKESKEQMKETKEQMKDTDRRIKETAERIKETDEQMKRTDKKLNKYMGNVGNYWGKLGENLIKGNLAKRLRERGIKVEKVITNAKFNGVEFDIIAINGQETVIVEVKATLDPSDVEYFKENMKQFKSLWPEFKKKTVYGAMAYLVKANRQAENLAQKEGFFVISATGDVIVQNKQTFKPKIF